MMAWPLNLFDVAKSTATVAIERATKSAAQQIVRRTKSRTALGHHVTHYLSEQPPGSPLTQRKQQAAERRADRWRWEGERETHRQAAARAMMLADEGDSAPAPPMRAEAKQRCRDSRAQWAGARTGDQWSYGGGARCRCADEEGEMARSVAGYVRWRERGPGGSADLAREGGREGARHRRSRSRSRSRSPERTGGEMHNRGGRDRSRSRSRSRSRDRMRQREGEEEAEEAHPPRRGFRYVSNPMHATAPARCPACNGFITEDDAVAQPAGEQEAICAQAAAPPTAPSAAAAATGSSSIGTLLSSLEQLSSAGAGSGGGGGGMYASEARGRSNELTALQRMRHCTIQEPQYFTSGLSAR